MDSRRRSRSSATRAGQPPPRPGSAGIVLIKRVASSWERFVRPEVYPSRRSRRNTRSRLRRLRMREEFTDRRFPLEIIGAVPETSIRVPMTSAHAQYDRSRLFLVSVLALATTGIGFSVRSTVASALQVSLFDPVDPLRSAEMVASVLGMVFLGFALTIPIGSALLDFLGMGRL